MRHYKALLAASLRLHLPLRFRTDLTRHDRTFCAASDERSAFLWLLYNDGTHLVRPCPSGRPSHSGAYLAQLMSGFDRAVWFGWDGEQLHELPDAAAAACFLAQHPAPVDVRAT